MTQQDYILQAFSSMSLIPDKMDVQDEPLYDTITVSAGSNLTQIGSTWFANVGASANPQKNLSQTNLQFPNRLPAPEAFSVMQFALRWQENISLLDLYNLISGFAFRFTMNQKPYHTAPIWAVPAGGGVWGVDNQSFTNTSGTILTNGMPTRAGMRSIGVYIVIENQGSFSADLEGNTYTFNASGTGLTMQCLAGGLHARGVN